MLPSDKVEGSDVTPGQDSAVECGVVKTSNLGPNVVSDTDDEPLGWKLASFRHVTSFYSNFFSCFCTSSC